MFLSPFRVTRDGVPNAVKHNEIDSLGLYSGFMILNYSFLILLRRMVGLQFIEGFDKRLSILAFKKNLNYGCKKYFLFWLIFLLFFLRWGVFIALNRL